MSRLFFLSSLLPQLGLIDPLELFFDDLRFLYEANLGPRDKALFKQMRVRIDLANIAKVIEGRPIDPRGNLTEHELDEALLHKVFGFEELFYFLDAFEDQKEQLAHFPQIELLFLKQESKKCEGFLSFYFRFEFEVHLALASYRGLKLDLEPLAVLSDELKEDEFVQHLAAQTDVRSWMATGLVSDLKEVLVKHEAEPAALHEAITQYKFNKIQSVMEEIVFSVDYILGYFALFMLVEDYQKLKKTQKHQWLDTVCEGIR